MITHSKVALEEEDFAAVMKVLRSGQLAQGSAVASLEDKVASFIGVNHAVAVSSGTAALHLSLLSLGIGHGSEVILPSYVCTALLNAIRYVKATPILVDIDPKTYNIAAEGAKTAVSRKTGAIIVPHMFGLPADKDGILSLGIPVIEDCAQSVGARVRGECVGSFGNISMLSLYATKMLCGGEGGLVLSNDADLVEKVRDLREYDEKEGYTVRYNYKLTNMQAALGESQLRKLPTYIEKRRKIASIYNTGLGAVVSHLPLPGGENEHVYYRYVILVDDAPGFMTRMKEKGIECRRPVYKPLHRYFNLSGYPVTDEVWEKAVSIPIYPSLTEGEAHKVVAEIRNLL